MLEIHSYSCLSPNQYLAILIFIHSPRAGNCDPNIFVFIFLVDSCFVSTLLIAQGKQNVCVILTSITILLWKKIYNPLSIEEPLNLSIYKEGFRANRDINTSLQLSFCNLKASPEHLATLASSEHFRYLTTNLRSRLSNHQCFLKSLPINCCAFSPCELVSIIVFAIDHDRSPNPIQVFACTNQQSWCFLCLHSLGQETRYWHNHYN